MVQTKIYLPKTLSALLLIIGCRCLAMKKSNPDEYRREVLEVNAHLKLYKKMNAITANNILTVEPLTDDEQYLLLKRLDERIHIKPPMTLRNRAFFTLLKSYTSPAVRNRAFFQQPMLSEIFIRHTSPTLLSYDEQQAAGASEELECPEVYTTPTSPVLPIQSPAPIRNNFPVDEDTVFTESPLLIKLSAGDLFSLSLCGRESIPEEPEENSAA